MNDSPLETTTEVLDLESLKMRCLGNIDLVERVLSKFTGQLDQDLDALEDAIRTSNAEQAAHVAHRIKGIAASVSAHSLFTNAANAEQRALDQNVAELPDQLNLLRRDRSRLAEYVRLAERQLR